MNIQLRNSLRAATLFAFISVIFATTASADITSVVRTGTPVDGECAISYQPIVDGAVAYCDRTSPAYTYTGFPQELVDVLAAGELVEYVIVPVEARADDDYGLEMTVDSGGTVLLFVPDSVDVETQLSWAFGSYSDTGLDLTLDKAGEFANVNMNIWQRDTDGSAGETIVFGPQGAGSNDALYAVAYASDLVDIQVVATNLGSEPVVAGVADDWHIELVASNNGPSPADGVKFEVDITVSEGSFLSGCSITPVDGDGTWTTISDTANPDGSFTLLREWDIGILDPGQLPKVEYLCTVSPGVSVGATAEVTAVLTAVDQKDTDDTNDSDSVLSTIAREYDLALTVVDSPDPVLAGSGTGNLTHTFTLSRSGPSDAAGVAVELVPTLPVGVTLDGAVASIGSVVGTTWTVGDWPAAGNGADQTLTLTLTVPSSVGSCTDCISAQGTVSATSGTDTNADNNVAIDPTSVTAASDITTTFATSIDFTNDDDSTVMAMLTCNAGNPLTQSFDISEGSPVNFTITNLPFTTDGTTCEITVDGLGDAYMLAPESCLYEAGDFAEDGMNVCAFVASPMPTAVEVVTDFAGVEDPNIDTSFETAISCDSVSPDAEGPYGAVDVTVTSSPFMADWYADPDTGTTCTVTLTPMSSAAEGDMCEFSFMLGDEEAGCTVVATVFFEGIPTLSQYGMAIMVLLMLGVGFVGMRRFV